MSYFNHHYASNSDLKEIVARHEGHEKPNNLEDIFDFGTEFHAGILEPHKSDLSRLSATDQALIKAMSKTFWKDQLCRDLALMPDFKREHEFYRSNRFGIGARCKADGISKSCRVILELKGLKVNSRKSFLDSVMHLNYDQGAAWYLNVASSDHHRYQYQLIVGISKVDPDQMYKLLIDRSTTQYASGKQKIEKAVKIWKLYGFN